MSAAVLLVLPFACAWAKWQEIIILKKGVPLSVPQTETARRLQILHPERVRLWAVAQVPPLNRLLWRIGRKLGFLPIEPIGMTLRYGIFIREDHWGDHRVLVHELAHVAQYERLGGFWPFLSQYLKECIDPGYPLGSLEREAKEAERCADGG